MDAKKEQAEAKRLRKNEQRKVAFADPPPRDKPTGAKLPEKKDLAHDSKARIAENRAASAARTEARQEATAVRRAARTAAWEDRV